MNMKKSAIVIFASLCAICGFAVDATYVQSEVSIPYTPTAAVAAGDVIVLSNNLVAVANRAIAADALGSINLRGVYKMAKGTSTTYLGQNVYWDEDGNQYGTTTGTGCITTSASGNNWCGWAIEASTATDDTVKVMLYPLGNVDATTLTVSGNGTIGGTLEITGALTPSGGVVGPLAVTGAETISTTLGVTGLATLNNLTVNTNVVVAGNTAIAGTLVVTGVVTHVAAPKFTATTAAGAVTGTITNIPNTVTSTNNPSYINVTVGTTTYCVPAWPLAP